MQQDRADDVVAYVPQTPAADPAVAEAVAEAVADPAARSNVC
jgi:hypothetical protein